MNWLDYLLIAILGFSALQSFRRGIAREIISLCAAFAALALGMWFYPEAGALVRQWVHSDRTADFLGFLLIVFAVLIAGSLIGSTVRRFVKAVGLSFFDRLLGACFGLLRGILIAVALLTGYIAFGPRSEPKTAPSAVIHSQIAPWILEVSSVIVNAAPAELRRDFHEMYEEARLEIENPARTDSKGATDKNRGRNERKF